MNVKIPTKYYHKMVSSTLQDTYHLYSIQFKTLSLNLRALSINVALTVMSLGKCDVNGMVGNVTMHKQKRLQHKIDTYLGIQSRNLDYLQLQ